MLRFPPRRRRRMVELILIEIVALPAERSRGRHNPRVVKRKMSSFPTKARAAPPLRQVFRYEEHIRIVAPVGMPGCGLPPPTVSLEEKPKRRRKQASAPIYRHPPWLGHVHSWRISGLSRLAYCECHRLNPQAFNQWVARARQILRRKTAPDQA